MDREKRLVLVDMNGSRTNFYVSPSAGSVNPLSPFSGGRGPARAARPSGSETFFNSRLVGFLAATAGGKETEGHARFVAAYTAILAEALGLMDRRTLGGLERGALLHDIGKAGVPAAILNQPGPLTSVEREIVREHPVLGHRMIEGLGFLKEAGEIILCHHEWFDGSGYPRGLSGRDIPLPARIFALADTLDAVTSDRPYRRGRRFEDAFREIERASGVQFDPDIVRVFLSVPADAWRKAKTGVRFSNLLPSVN